jgi:hypothetical protein
LDDPEELPRLRDLRNLAQIRAAKNNQRIKAENLAKFFNIAKITTQYVSCSDLDKLEHIFVELRIPYTINRFVIHPLYPFWSTGVHLFTLTHYLPGYLISFDLIFSPVTLMFVGFDIRINQE